MGKLVLVVDDYPDTRELFTEYLRMNGFDTAEAENGREAIDRARAMMPAAIVMDIAMPVLDGATASDILKNDPRTASIPIVAVTGQVQPSDAGPLCESCDCVLFKPIAPDRLLAQLEQLLG